MARAWHLLTDTEVAEFHPEGLFKIVQKECTYFVSPERCYKQQVLGRKCKLLLLIPAQKEGAEECRAVLETGLQGTKL